MPIQGLTTRAATFPEIGQIRKGAPKPEQGNKPGADLKHFRFDSDDQGAMELFQSVYGNEPRSIRIFVPFQSTDDNFEAWQEEWAASSLKHRCDGEKCVLWLTPQGTYSKDAKACPGGCKASGRLKVIIPELKRLAYVTVLTTSKHDIMNIHANLLALESARGDLRGIPLLLKRVPREISTPAGDGKRARREKWLISIEAQPDWVALQLSAQQQAALPVANTLALPAYDGDDDDDENDRIEAAARPTSEEIEIIAALGRIMTENGKTVREFETYMHEHILPLSIEEKRALLNKWQTAALKKAEKAAAATETATI